MRISGHDRKVLGRTFASEILLHAYKSILRVWNLRLLKNNGLKHEPGGAGIRLPSPIDEIYALKRTLGRLNCS